MLVDGFTAEVLELFAFSSLAGASCENPTEQIIANINVNVKFFMSFLFLFLILSPNLGKIKILLL